MVVLDPSSAGSAFHLCAVCVIARAVVFPREDTCVRNVSIDNWLGDFLMAHPFQRTRRCSVFGQSFCTLIPFTKLQSITNFRHPYSGASRARAADCTLGLFRLANSDSTIFSLCGIAGRTTHRVQYTATGSCTTTFSASRNVRPELFIMMEISKPNISPYNVYPLASSTPVYTRSMGYSPSGDKITLFVLRCPEPSPDHPSIGGSHP